MSQIEVISFGIVGSRFKKSGVFSKPSVFVKISVPSKNGLICIHKTPTVRKSVAPSWGSIVFDKANVSAKYGSRLVIQAFNGNDTNLLGHSATSLKELSNLLPNQQMRLKVPQKLQQKKGKNDACPGILTFRNYTERVYSLHTTDVEPGIALVLSKARIIVKFQALWRGYGMKKERDMIRAFKSNLKRESISFSITNKGDVEEEIKESVITPKPRSKRGLQRSIKSKVILTPSRTPTKTDDNNKNTPNSKEKTTLTCDNNIKTVTIDNPQNEEDELEITNKEIITPKPSKQPKEKSTRVLIPSKSNDTKIVEAEPEPLIMCGDSTQDIDTPVSQVKPLNEDDFPALSPPKLAPPPGLKRLKKPKKPNWKRQRRLSAIRMMGLPQAPEKSQFIRDLDTKAIPIIQADEEERQVEKKRIEEEKQQREESMYSCSFIEAIEQCGEVTEFSEFQGMEFGSDEFFDDGSGVMMMQNQMKKRSFADVASSFEDVKHTSVDLRSSKAFTTSLKRPQSMSAVSFSTDKMERYRQRLFAAKTQQSSMAFSFDDVLIHRQCSRGVTAFQALWKGFHQRYLEKKCHSSIVIQAFWRCYIHKKRYNDFIRTIGQLQTRWKLYLLRCKMQGIIHSYSSVDKARNTMKIQLSRRKNRIIDHKAKAKKLANSVVNSMKKRQPPPPNPPSLPKSPLPFSQNPPRPPPQKLSHAKSPKAPKTQTSSHKNKNVQKSTTPKNRRRRQSTSTRRLSIQLGSSSFHFESLPVVPSPNHNVSSIRKNSKPVSAKDMIAAKIQSIWRGHVIRDDFRLMKNAAIMIQSVFRMHYVSINLPSIVRDFEENNDLTGQSKLHNSSNDDIFNIGEYQKVKDDHLLWEQFGLKDHKEKRRSPHNSTEPVSPALPKSPSTPLYANPPSNPSNKSAERVKRRSRKRTPTNSTNSNRTTLRVISPPHTPDFPMFASTPYAGIHDANANYSTFVSTLETSPVKNNNHNNTNRRSSPTPPPHPQAISNPTTKRISPRNNKVISPRQHHMPSPLPSFIEENSDEEDHSPMNNDHLVFNGPGGLTEMKFKLRPNLVGNSNAQLKKQQREIQQELKKQRYQHSSKNNGRRTPPPTLSSSSSSSSSSKVHNNNKNGGVKMTKKALNTRTTTTTATKKKKRVTPSKRTTYSTSTGFSNRLTAPTISSDNKCSPRLSPKKKNATVTTTTVTDIPSMSPRYKTSYNANTTKSYTSSSSPDKQLLPLDLNGPQTSTNTSRFRHSSKQGVTTSLDFPMDRLFALRKTISFSKDKDVLFVSESESDTEDDCSVNRNEFGRSSTNGNSIYVQYSKRKKPAKLMHKFSVANHWKGVMGKDKTSPKVLRALEILQKQSEKVALLRAAHQKGKTAVTQSLKEKFKHLQMVNTELSEVSAHLRDHKNSGEVVEWNRIQKDGELADSRSLSDLRRLCRVEALSLDNLANICASKISILESQKEIARLRTKKLHLKEKSKKSDLELLSETVKKRALVAEKELAEKQAELRVIEDSHEKTVETIKEIDPVIKNQMLQQQMEFASSLAEVEAQEEDIRNISTVSYAEESSTKQKIISKNLNRERLLMEREKQMRRITMKKRFNDTTEMVKTTLQQFMSHSLTEAKEEQDAIERRRLELENQLNRCNDKLRIANVDTKCISVKLESARNRQVHKEEIKKKLGENAHKELLRMMTSKIRDLEIQEKTTKERIQSMNISPPKLLNPRRNKRILSSSHRPNKRPIIFRRS